MSHYYSDEQKAERNKPPEMVEKRAVSIQDVHSAFRNQPKKWNACLTIRNKIKSKEEGYVDSKYRNYRVIDITDNYRYELYRSGDQLTVSLKCNFSAMYEINIWSRPIEKYSYDGGIFEMKIHYDKYNRLTGLSFN